MEHIFQLNAKTRQYYNYLKLHLIVLMAIVGPDYQFLYTHIGAYERNNSDGGIFEQSEIGKKF